jgi:hypothetical protein
LVAGIQGRQEDLLFLPGTTATQVRIMPHLFHTVMDVIPVREWQITEEAGGLHVLASGVREGYSPEALATSLQGMLSAHGAARPVIHVSQEASLQRSATDKVVSIKSKGRNS